MAEKASTRKAYGEALLQLGHERPEIVVVSADLAKSTQVRLFGNAFPDRFFEVGIAEQNMMSIAAGLAAEGKTAFASTFAVFATNRAYDQIRICIAQPHLNVKIVTTHAGLITGPDGSSHQAVEDLSLMSSLPGFTVIVPADAPEVGAAVRAAADTNGPFYIRLSRPDTPVVHTNGCDFTIGKAETMRSGDDATIIAMGVMVSEALKAWDILSQEGIRCRVLNMATLKPLDVDAVLQAARETGAIVTAEEHFLHGGLGSAVARTVAQHCPVPLEFIAVNDIYGRSGQPEELLAHYGLTAQDIVGAVRSVLRRKR